MSKYQLCHLIPVRHVGLDPDGGDVGNKPFCRGVDSQVFTDSSTTRGSYHRLDQRLKFIQANIPDRLIHRPDPDENAAVVKVRPPSSVGT